MFLEFFIKKNVIQTKKGEADINLQLYRLFAHMNISSDYVK